MRISDWSSDVCSSDLERWRAPGVQRLESKRPYLAGSIWLKRQGSPPPCGPAYRRKRDKLSFRSPVVFHNQRLIRTNLHKHGHDHNISIHIRSFYSTFIGHDTPFFPHRDHLTPFGPTFQPTKL